MDKVEEGQQVQVLQCGDIVFRPGQPVAMYAETNGSAYADQYAAQAINFLRAGASQVRILVNPDYKEVIQAIAKRIDLLECHGFGEMVDVTSSEPREEGLPFVMCITLLSPAR